MSRLYEDGFLRMDCGGWGSLIELSAEKQPNRPALWEFTPHLPEAPSPRAPMINEEAATQMSTVNPRPSCQSKPNKKRRDGETLTCCLQEEGLVQTMLMHRASIYQLPVRVIRLLVAYSGDPKTTVKGKGECWRRSQRGPPKKEGFIIACMHNASPCQPLDITRIATARLLDLLSSIMILITPKEGIQHISIHPAQKDEVISICPHCFRWVRGLL